MLMLKNELILEYAFNKRIVIRIIFLVYGINYLLLVSVLIKYQKVKHVVLKYLVLCVLFIDLKLIHMYESAETSLGRRVPPRAGAPGSLVPCQGDRELGRLILIGFIPYFINMILV